MVHIIYMSNLHGYDPEANCTVAGSRREQSARWSKTKRGDSVSMTSEAVGAHSRRFQMPYHNGCVFRTARCLNRKKSNFIVNFIHNKVDKLDIYIVDVPKWPMLGLKESEDMVPRCPLKCLKRVGSVSSTAFKMRYKH